MEGRLANLGWGGSRRQRAKWNPAVSKVSWTSSTTPRKRCFAHKGAHWRNASRPHVSHRVPTIPDPPLEAAPSTPSLTVHSCRCGRLTDRFGHHRSACPVAGVLGTRGFPLENAAARICREGGGRVRTNVLVRDMDIGVFNPLDTRRLEVVVDGLPLFRGAQIAVDTTLVCPLTREGRARPRCANVSGAAIAAARRRKERRYPELSGDNARARLIVLAAEVGGRFSAETSQFLRGMASAKVRGLPQVLQGRAHAGWVRRWSAMLGCTAARAFAVSLLDRVPAGVDGPEPSVHEVMRDGRHLL